MINQLAIAEKDFRHGRKVAKPNIVTQRQEKKKLYREELIVVPPLPPQHDEIQVSPIDFLNSCGLQLENVEELVTSTDPVQCFSRRSTSSTAKKTFQLRNSNSVKKLDLQVQKTPPRKSTPLWQPSLDLQRSPSRISQCSNSTCNYSASHSIFDRSPSRQSIRLQSGQSSPATSFDTGSSPISSINSSPNFTISDRCSSSGSSITCSPQKQRKEKPPRLELQSLKQVMVTSIPFDSPTDPNSSPTLYFGLKKFHINDEDDENVDPFNSRPITKINRSSSIMYSPSKDFPSSDSQVGLAM